MKNSIDKNDWRLMGQEQYLKGKKIIHSSYREEDGHSHCEFCSVKFGMHKGELHNGYCTTDRYHWICEKCFQDFNELFEWK